MADQDDVRRIALSLPEAREDENHFAFTVENKGKKKGFAWVWMERLAPKKPRVPNPQVLAVRVRDESEKALLLAGDPERFFTEPHYNGFPAVLVRLRAVTPPQLRKLLFDAWCCQAPRTLVEGAAGKQRVNTKGKSSRSRSERRSTRPGRTAARRPTGR